MTDQLTADPLVAYGIFCFLVMSGFALIVAAIGFGMWLTGTKDK